MDPSKFTYKMMAFLESPMDYNLPVTAVPGIDREIGYWLMQREITTASQLYSYYLMSGWEFKNLIYYCHGNIENHDRAYYAMEFWDKYRGCVSRVLHFCYFVKSYCGLPPADIYTKKMIAFLREPIFNKPVDVEAVPGIGEEIGRKLRLKKIRTALDLYHFYRQNGAEKLKGLIKECGGNKRFQNVAYFAIIVQENIYIYIF